MKRKIDKTAAAAVVLPVDLRDYFATHAPDPPEWWLKQQRGSGANDLQQLVRWRWVWAEAMLAGKGIAHA